MRILATIVLASATALAQTPAPDILYVHGDFLTGAHLQPSDTSRTPARVSAIAVTHGTITAVGSDVDILKLKSATTTVIDLHGAFAMPGFNDAHTHIASAGRQKLTVDLDGTTSLAEMLSRIRKYAASAAPGAWLEGAAAGTTPSGPGQNYPPAPTLIPSPADIRRSSLARMATSSS